MNINEDGCQPWGWPWPWWWLVYQHDTPTQITNVNWLTTQKYTLQKRYITTRSNTLLHTHFETKTKQSFISEALQGYESNAEGVSDHQKRWVEPEIFQNFKHEVVWILHFTQFTEKSHIALQMNTYKHILKGVLWGRVVLGTEKVTFSARRPLNLSNFCDR